MKNLIEWLTTIASIAVLIYLLHNKHEELFLNLIGLSLIGFIIFAIKTLRDRLNGTTGNS